jgi:hypothetical protein
VPVIVLLLVLAPACSRSVTAKLRTTGGRGERLFWLLLSGVLCPLRFGLIRTSLAPRAATDSASLLQFRVFGFGFVEEGDVGIGVFPGGEKILISDAGFGGVTLLLIDPAQFELCGND